MSQQCRQPDDIAGILRKVAASKGVPYLTGEQVERVLVKVLARKFKYFQEKAIIALAPYLIGEQVERVLEMALRLEDDERRTALLVTLIPYLTGTGSYLTISDRLARKRKFISQKCTNRHVPAGHHHR